MGPTLFVEALRAVASESDIPAFSFSLLLAQYQKDLCENLHPFFYLPFYISYTLNGVVCINDCSPVLNPAIVPAVAGCNADAASNAFWVLAAMSA